MTITDEELTVRWTRVLRHLEPQHVDWAREVSAVARAHEAAPDRPHAQAVPLAIAAQPDLVGLGFWRAVLGDRTVADNKAVDPISHGSMVWMQLLNPGKPLRHARHVDVSVAREQVAGRLAAALAAGGRIVDESHAPAWWTLADRAATVWTSRRGRVSKPPCGSNPAAG